MTEPNITITLAPWHTMIRELFSWCISLHPTINATARAIGVPATCVATWTRSGVPRAVRGIRRKTEGWAWDDDAQALLGPGCAMVQRRGAKLWIEGDDGGEVEIEISAVLEALEHDPGRGVTTGRPR